MGERAGFALLAAASRRAHHDLALSGNGAGACCANPLIVGLCLLTLAIVWKGLMSGSRWGFGALLISLLSVQAFGFVSDAYLGHHNLVANVVSTIVLVAGLALSGCSVFRNRPLDGTASRLGEIGLSCSARARGKPLGADCAGLRFQPAVSGYVGRPPKRRAEGALRARGADSLRARGMPACPFLPASFSQGVQRASAPLA